MGPWWLVGLMAAGLTACSEPAGGTTPDASPPGDTSSTDTGFDAAEAVDVGAEVQQADTGVSEPIPCLTATPTNAQFGGKLCFNTATLDLTLTACGPTTVTGLELTRSPEALDQEASDEFGIVPPAGGPMWTLATGEALTLQLSYSPDGNNARDTDGKPVMDTAGLAVSAEGVSGPLLVVPFSGFGVGEACPVAVIQIDVPGPYTVGEPIALDGTQSRILSCLPTGAAAYEWFVTAPAGASAVFDDTAAAKPTLTTDSPGMYQVRLRIFDDFNVQSCQDAEVLLEVVAR